MSDYEIFAPYIDSLGGDHVGGLAARFLFGLADNDFHFLPLLVPQFHHSKELDFPCLQYSDLLEQLLALVHSNN